MKVIIVVVIVAIILLVIDIVAVNFAVIFLDVIIALICEKF